MKYQYKMVQFNVPNKAAQVWEVEPEYLAKLGADGWEVVSVMPSPDHTLCYRAFLRKVVK